MNLRTTLVLFILACVGGGLFFLYGGKPATETAAPEPEKPKQATKYVFDPRPETSEVTRVVVEVTGKSKFVFERSGNKDASGQMEPWQFAEPITGPVEGYMIEGVAGVLGGLQSTRSITPGTPGAITAADAGLQPPQASITIATKAGKEFKLEIGKRPAISNETYVRVAGTQEILLTTRDFEPDLKRQPKDLRGKTPIKFRPNNAVAVQAEYEGRKFEFSKQTGDEWLIFEPVKSHAEKDAVRALTSALSGLRLQEYIEDAPTSLAQFGLDRPYLTIAVTTEEKKPSTQPASAPTTDSAPAEPQMETIRKTHTLLVGGFANIDQSRRFVKLPDSPWVASVEKSAVESLTPDLTKLRDKRVTRVKEADATQLEIAVGGNAAALKRVDGQWQGDGDLADLDRDALKQLLQAFEDLRAIEFIDSNTSDQRYGFATPRATLRLSTSNAIEPVMLLIGANTPSGRNAYVQVAGQTSVAVITSEQADRLAIPPMGLRSRAIFSHRAEDIRSIEIDREDRKMKLTWGNVLWTINEPAGAVVDAAGIREITQNLALMRARQVVARDADAAYGLDLPIARIRFEVEQMPPQPTTDSAPAAPPAPERKSYSIALSRKDSKSYCRRDDLPYVFEIDQTVLEALLGELIDRNLHPMAASDIDSIKIESNNGGIDFARDGKNWTNVPDSTVKLSTKKVDDLANEFANLRVERFIKFADAAIPEPSVNSIRISLKFKDGGVMSLILDQLQQGQPPRKATWVEQKRSFLLRPGDAEKFIRGLDAFIKMPDEDKPAAPAAPGMPGGAPTGPRPAAPGPRPPTP
ncbi:MAG: DUF4340 domain-containing protein [Phycisphaerae bacterium]